MQSEIELDLIRRDDDLGPNNSRPKITREERSVLIPESDFDKPLGQALVKSGEGKVNPYKGSESNVKYARYSPTSIAAKENEVRIGEMKVRMLALYREDHTYPEICDRINKEFGISMVYQNVIYHIKNMLEYWKQQTASTFEHKQALVLARLHQIEEMAVEGFYRSMLGKETRGVEKKISKMRGHEYRREIKRVFDEEIKKAKKEKRDPEFPTDRFSELTEQAAVEIKKYRRMETLGAGNEKFLRIMLDCTRERAKIWQLYKERVGEDDMSKAAALTDSERNERLTGIINMAIARRIEQKNGPNGNLAPGGPLGKIHESNIPISQKKRAVLNEMFNF